MHVGMRNSLVKVGSFLRVLEFSPTGKVDNYDAGLRFNSLKENELEIHHPLFSLLVRER